MSRRIRTITLIAATPALVVTFYLDVANAATQHRSFMKEKQKKLSARNLTAADQKKLLKAPASYKVKLYLIILQKESARYGNSIAQFLWDHNYNVEVCPKKI